MPYKLLSFEKSDDTLIPTFVAYIQKVGEAQPFRIVIEHFDDEDLAIKEVSDWIDAREQEDLIEKAQKEQSAQKDKADKALAKLNKRVKS